jgi:heme ABC exporter ATP-binding subunit CcmA
VAAQKSKLVKQQLLSKIIIENLSKFFGDLRALHGVSVSLEAGQGLAIVGANGAGKSTLLNCIAGISKPEKGSVEMPRNANIGYLAHKSFLYDEMTVAANLHFWGRLAGVKNYKSQAAQLIEIALLTKRANDKVGTLSAGMQKRVAFCRAIMNKPDILLLDEPYSAFDQEGMTFLKRIIAQVRKAGGIVIMATHYLEQAINDCSHMALLCRGKIELFEGIENINLKALREKLSPVAGAV